MELIVVGYPRSGNCWLARLLGEALDVRVVGIHDGSDSIAAEGFEREGEGYVKQAHLWPGKEGHLRVNLDGQQGHTFVHMIRNPRDIAVSMAYFWGWTLDEALDRMIIGPGPLDLPSWSVYVESWLEHYVPILRYEDFHGDAEGWLRLILDHLGLEPQKELAGVVKNQSFDARLAEMKRHGNKYPFGREAQLKHLRNGHVGDWEQEFTKEQIKRTTKAWNGLLRKLGYDA